jgi:hypothetical protein
MGLLDDVAKFTEDAIKVAGETIDDVGKTVSDTVGDAVDTVGDFAGEVADGTVAVAEDIGDTVIEVASDVVDTVCEVGEDVIDGACGIAEGTVEVVDCVGEAIVDGAIVLGSIPNHIIPIKENEVDQFQMLISEEIKFFENPERVNFSKGFSPELVKSIYDFNLIDIGIRGIIVAFSGMDKNVIAINLADIGYVTAGIVAQREKLDILDLMAPFVHVFEQNQLGETLDQLFYDSFVLEKEMEHDEREEVIKLLQVTKQYREHLAEKHFELRRHL